MVACFVERGRIQRDMLQGNQALFSVLCRFNGFSESFPRPDGVIACCSGIIREREETAMFQDNRIRDPVQESVKFLWCGIMISGNHENGGGRRPEDFVQFRKQDFRLRILGIVETVPSDKEKVRHAFRIKIEDSPEKFKGQFAPSFRDQWIGKTRVMQISDHCAAADLLLGIRKSVSRILADGIFHRDSFFPFRSAGNAMLFSENKSFSLPLSSLPLRAGNGEDMEKGAMSFSLSREFHVI